MGTIASVLQWTCTNCNLINPTECLKCLNCGNIRRIHVDDAYTHDGDDKHRIGSENNNNASRSSIETKSQNCSQAAAAGAANTDENNGDAGDCNSKQMSNGQRKLFEETNATTSTILTGTAHANNKILHKTLPGYVEINSNG